MWKRLVRRLELVEQLVWNAQLGGDARHQLVSYDRPNQSLRFFSSPGHTYQTMTSGNLSGWQASGSPVAGTGVEMSIPAPNDGGARFFRVEVVRP